MLNAGGRIMDRSRQRVSPTPPYPAASGCILLKVLRYVCWINVEKIPGTRCNIPQCPHFSLDFQSTEIAVSSQSHCYSYIKSHSFQRHSYGCIQQEMSGDLIRKVRIKCNHCFPAVFRCPRRQNRWFTARISTDELHRKG